MTLDRPNDLGRAWIEFRTVMAIRRRANRLETCARHWLYFSTIKRT